MLFWIWLCHVWTLWCIKHITRLSDHWHKPFSGWKVKDQGQTGRFKLLECPLCSSVPISLIHFRWDIHITHEVSRSFAPSPGPKVKGQGHMGHLKFLFLLCPLHGFLLIWPNHFMWHAYNTWGVNVSNIIFRMKGQRSRSYRLFEVLALSVLWLHPYLTELLHMLHINNTGGRCVELQFPDERSKVQFTKVICSFCHVHSVASSLSYSISQEVCTWFCCALLCCGYAIVHN